MNQMTELFCIKTCRFGKYAYRCNATRMAKRMVNEGRSECFVMFTEGRYFLGTPSYKGLRYFFDWRPISPHNAARIVRESQQRLAERRAA